MIKKRLFLFFFMQLFLLGLVLSIYGPLIPILADNFKVSLYIIGSVLSMNAFGLLLAGLFSGILSERFGKKNIFILGNILFTVSILGLYLSSHFIYFTLSWIVCGISWGIISVSVFSIISDNFKSNKSKTIVRLNIGSIAGCFTAPILVSIILFFNISWRYLFLFIIPINMLLLILSVKLEGLSNKKNKENFISLFTINRKFLLSLIIILYGIICFLHFGLGFTFGAWFTTYFKSLNVPVGTGSLIFSLYLLIAGLGMFVKSYLVNKFSEKKVMQFFSILAFIFLFTSFFIDLFVLKTILIFLFGFSFSGIYEISLAMSIKQSPRYSGSITSIMQSFGFMGAIVFQYTTSYLIKNYSPDIIIYISLVALLLLIIFISILFFFQSKNIPLNLKNEVNP